MRLNGGRGEEEEKKEKKGGQRRGVRENGVNGEGGKGEHTAEDVVPFQTGKKKKKEERRSRTRAPDTRGGERHVAAGGDTVCGEEEVAAPLVSN